MGGFGRGLFALAGAGGWCEAIVLLSDGDWQKQRCDEHSAFAQIRHRRWPGGGLRLEPAQKRRHFTKQNFASRVMPFLQPSIIDNPCPEPVPEILKKPQCEI